MTEMHDLDALTPVRLAAVRAVASTGSFSAAARFVGSSQSNVSRAVAAVEAALGVAVFDRSTRSVHLTGAGREFVERITQAQAELEAAVRAIRPEAPLVPRLTIASLTSVSELHLAPALAGLGEPRPRFRCIEGLQAGVEQAVVSGNASLGIADLADVAPGLVTRPLWREPFRLVVPTGHRLGRRSSISLPDIADEPLVGFSRDAELRSTIDRELASARQLRAPDHVVDRYRTALSLVAAGLGVMVVPAIAAGAVPRGARLVPLDQVDLRRTMGVITRADSTVPPMGADLIARVVDEVRRVDGVDVVDNSGTVF